MLNWHWYNHWGSVRGGGESAVERWYKEHSKAKGNEDSCGWVSEQASKVMQVWQWWVEKSSWNLNFKQGLQGSVCDCWSCGFLFLVVTYKSAGLSFSYLLKAIARASEMSYCVAMFSLQIKGPDSSVSCSLSSPLTLRQSECKMLSHQHRSIWYLLCWGINGYTRCKAVGEPAPRSAAVYC